MCGQKTAIRRRKQMAKGNKHIAPLRRSRVKATNVVPSKKTKGGR